MSFSKYNGLSLDDHQRLLIALVRPDLVEDSPLKLSAASRRFLIRTLGETPIELGQAYKGLKRERFKLMIDGLLKVIDENDLVYRNKAGRAYGFHVENAYVEHRRTKRAFFLAATIYVNADGRLNDDRYEHRQISFPFYRNLGQLLGRQLLSRSSRRPPPVPAR
jgi:hypothetical protein